MMLTFYLLLLLLGCVVISISVAQFIRGYAVRHKIFGIIALIVGGIMIITAIMHLAVK